MRRLSLACLLFVSPSVLAAAPAAPGYAQAEAWLEKEARPDHYVPLNLLDGRDTTVWCAEGEKPSHVFIGFKEPVTLDEVRVYTGDGTSRDAFKANGRVRKFTLTSVDASRSVTVQDKRGLQAVPLSQPLFGARFILEVADRFPGAKEDSPVCLTDLVLYSGGKPLNGPALATRYKYDARVSRSWAPGSVATRARRSASCPSSWTAPGASHWSPWRRPSPPPSSAAPTRCPATR
ncbi:discoidin domain-containing protein [Corallococcus sp. M7]